MRWGIIAALVLCCSVGLAEEPAAEDPKADFPFKIASPKVDWEWDKDERFDDLIEQLAINEASLEAVDKAIARKNTSTRSRQMSAQQFDSNNRFMDRKGGGPMNWKEFYGTNAEKFFYHPVDANTTYHTKTYLQQAGKSEDNKSGFGVPSSQSLPVHQRPPQWDYIYRANRTAREKALAGAAVLKSQVVELEQQRKLLETEQEELWCKLAFRAVLRHDMHRKPVLRFIVEPVSTSVQDIDQAATLSIAASFFKKSLQIVLKSEEDQPLALSNAKHLIVNAWNDLDDAILSKETLLDQANDTEFVLGQFMALAKRLRDTAKTLTEAFEGSNDELAAKDAMRKERYRGILQRNLVEYAQLLLALDELIDVMEKDWAIRLDYNTRKAEEPSTWSEVKVWDDVGVETRQVTPLPSSSKIYLIQENNLNGWLPVNGSRGEMKWRVSNGSLISIGSGEKDNDGTSIKSTKSFDNFKFHCEFMLPPSCNSGIFLRGCYEIQLLDTQYRGPNGQFPGPIGQTGAIFGQAAPSQLNYRGTNQWNTLDVTLVGNVVTVGLNDVTIIRNFHCQNRNTGLSNQNPNYGPIVIQSHSRMRGTQFQNMWIEPL